MFKFDEIISIFQENYAVYPPKDPGILEKYIDLTDSKNLYIFFPPWNGKLKKFHPIRKRVRQTGSSFFSFDVSRNILSADPQETIERFRKVEAGTTSEIRKIISENKIKNVRIIGMSIGCVSAMMTAKNLADFIDEIILVVPGHCLAESMWLGVRTQKFRKEMEKKGIDLAKIKMFWHNLAPENNLSGLENKRVKVFLSRADCIIPYECGGKLVSAMKKAGLQPVTETNNFLGHYLTCGKFIYFYPF